MSDFRRRRPPFWPWFAGTLAILVGSARTASAMRAPDAEAEQAAPTEVVLALPPKPQSEEAPEGDGSSERYTFERCEAMPAAFADTCFAALARQRAERDPDGGLDACGRIGEAELQQECMADVAEGHALVDPMRSRAICTTIQRKKWSDQCVFGIAMAWALEDTDFALRTCEDSGQWRPFCRHDVNGERAVVDPAGAVAYCRELPPRMKDTCWHGVGKYIGRENVSLALATCEEAPVDGDLRGQCVHGAGWAAAESNGSGALSVCEPLGVMRDSCVLGVAYHAKRYDPEEAVRLCQLASDAGERSHCLAFVRRAPGRVSLP